LKGRMMTVQTEELVQLRQIADQWEATQKVLFAAQNRSRSEEQGTDETPSQPDPVSPIWIEHMESAIAALMEVMESKIPTHPAYDWMMGVPGINRVMICRICGLIPMDTSDDFHYFSQLRKFAGLAPGFDKKVKGQKLQYNARLRVTLYIAYENMIKARANVQGKDWAPDKFYPDIYDAWRIEYAGRHGVGFNGRKWLEMHVDDVSVFSEFHEWEEKEDKKTGKTKRVAIWPDARQHFASIRKMMDVFLSHVWLEWRTNLEWSTEEFYAHAKLGHHTKYDRAEFSSEALATRKKK